MKRDRDSNQQSNNNEVISNKKQKIGSGQSSNQTNTDQQKVKLDFLTEEGKRLYKSLELSKDNIQKKYKKTKLHKALNYMALFFAGGLECAAAMILPDEEKKTIFIAANGVNAFKNKTKLGNSLKDKKLFFKLYYFQTLLNKQNHSSNINFNPVSEVALEQTKMVGDKDILLIKLVVLDRIREEYKSKESDHYIRHIANVIDSLFQSIHKKEKAQLINFNEIEKEEDEPNVNKSIIQILKNDKMPNDHSIQKLSDKVTAKLQKTNKPQPGTWVCNELIRYALRYYRRLLFLKGFLKSETRKQQINSFKFLFLGDQKKVRPTAKNNNNNNAKAVTFVQHAELKLIVFALKFLGKNEFAGMLRTPIGISKKSCRGCFMTLKMVNQVLRDFRNSNQMANNNNNNEISNSDDSFVVEEEKSDISTLHRNDSVIASPGTHDLSFKKRLPALFCKDVVDATLTKFCYVDFNKKIKNKKNNEENSTQKKRTNIIEVEVEAFVDNHLRQWRELAPLQNIKFNNGIEFKKFVNSKLKFYKKRHITKEEFEQLYSGANKKIPMYSSDAVDEVNVVPSSSSPSSQSNDEKEALYKTNKRLTEALKNEKEKSKRAILEAEQEKRKAEQKVSEVEKENKELKEQIATLKKLNEQIMMKFNAKEKIKLRKSSSLTGTFFNNTNQNENKDSDDDFSESKTFTNNNTFK